MNTEYLRINLYEKAYKEQQEFIAELKKSTPEKIIEQAYELVMREDILMTFEDDYLSPEQAKALLKLEYPLAACYRTWLKNDCSHMEMLRDTISDLGSKLVKENMQKEHNKKKKHKEKSVECR
ncbi:MAG: DUF3848 domain-containing protein [Clostridiales bacterium]|nr:DUF3848 domain-containing protein [Clostridiales bacterium]